MSDEALKDASPDRLLTAILSFLGEELLPREEVRLALEREIDAAGPGAVVELKARLTSDNGWEYYPPDALARRIHHLLAGRFLARDSSLHGIERLPASMCETGPPLRLSQYL